MLFISESIPLNQNNKSWKWSVFSPLCFSVPFLNLGLNNLDTVLRSMINEVIRVTDKIMVSMSIYHSTQSMNMAHLAIARGNLEQKFKW